MAAIGGRIDCANPVKRTSSLNRGLLGLFTVVPGLSHQQYTLDHGIGTIQSNQNIASFGFLQGGAKESGQSPLAGLGSFDLTASTSRIGIDRFRYRFSKSTSFSAFAWIKIPSVTTRNVISCVGSFGDLGWIFNINGSGNVQFCTTDGGGSFILQVRGGTLLSANRWHHVGFSFGGGQADSVELYANGFQQVKTVVNDNSVQEFTGTTARIGALDDSGTNPLAGHLADCRIYNRVVSPREAQQIYVDSLAGGRQLYNRLAFTSFGEPPAIVDALSRLLLLGVG